MAAIATLALALAALSSSPPAIDGSRHVGELLVQHVGDFPAALVHAAGPWTATRLSDRLAVVRFDERRIGLGAAMAALAGLPTVAHVEPNLRLVVARRRGAASATGAAPHAGRDLRPAQDPALRPWLTPRGPAGRLWAAAPAVRVGLLDTGIDAAHPDLAGHVEPGVELVDAAAAAAGGDGRHDPHGHGTAMAGIVGAGHNDFGIDGIDADARLVPVRAFDADGVGSLAAVIAGIDWATAHAVQVLSLSFGTHATSPLLAAAVARARHAGLLVVAAAGNDGVPEVASPARLPGVLAVGAHGGDGALAGYSNHGPRVDLYAPGDDVISCVSGALGPHGYAPVDGTSAATAHVSGLAARLWRATPGADAARVAARLLAHSVPHEGPDGTPLRLVDSAALLASLGGTPLWAVHVAQLQVAPRPDAGGAHAVAVRLVGHGNLGSPPLRLRLVLRHAARRWVLPLTTVPALGAAQGFSWRGAIQPPEALPRPATALLGVAVAAASGDGDGDGDGDGPLVLLDSDGPRGGDGGALGPRGDGDVAGLLSGGGGRPLPADTGELTVARLFVSPMSSTAAPPGAADAAAPTPQLHVLLVNESAAPTAPLRLRVSATGGVHEGLYAAPAQPLHPPHPVPAVPAGGRREVHLPLAAALPAGDAFSLLAEVTDAGAGTPLAHAYQSFAVAAGGQARLYYNQRAHMGSVAAAAELLRLTGTTVPDLHGPDSPYLGSPATARDFGGAIRVGAGKWRWNWQRDWPRYPEQARTFVDGASACDGIDVAFGDSGVDTWNTHYWIVDEGDDVGLAGHSAHTKVLALLLGGYGSQIAPGDGAIGAYRAGDRARAWWLLGHAAHLVGDLSCGAHTINRNWHGVVGDVYHDWLGQGGHHRAWPASVVRAGGGPLDPYAAEATPDGRQDVAARLRYLTYTTAQIGAAYPWHRTRGWMPARGHLFGSGDRTWGGALPHYDEAMARLFGGVRPHPLVPRDLVRDEARDRHGNCVAVPSLRPGDLPADCWDGGDGHVDVNNVLRADADGDLSAVADVAYAHAVRAIAGLVVLFARETGQL